MDLAQDQGTWLGWNLLIPWPRLYEFVLLWEIGLENQTLQHLGILVAFFLDHCLSLNIALLYFTVINQIMSYHSQGYLPPERHCLQPALSPNTNALMVGLQAAHETRCYFKKQEKKKKNPKRLIIMTFTRSNFFLNLTLLKDNMNQKSRDRHTFFFFSVKDRQSMRLLRAAWVLLHLLSSVITAQKQPQIICKQKGVAGFQYNFTEKHREFSTWLSGNEI